MSRKPEKRSFQPPKGTRDFYPREMLVRRYITDAWRRAALRHGFDEIDGPTFEEAGLYKVKSGEGILNEMFGAYSGKSADDVESVKRGEPPYGLRPEFTPTLARMYAARARQLPQPTKWFCVSNFFRAERPQRGRLREFWQWNCDMLGDEPMADPEVIACIADLLSDAGLTHADVSVSVSDRRAVAELLRGAGVDEQVWPGVFALLDAQDRMEPAELRTRAAALTLPDDLLFSLIPKAGAGTGAPRAGGAVESAFRESMRALEERLSRFGLAQWTRADASIVRGLAYYTGTVFEVVAEGERAVAGGGRYDGLIELFGGPPTPACGFGMGDAVLGNLLEDRGLIPDGREMAEALSRPMPVRPDVFVVPSPGEGCEELVAPAVARLRRGEESERYRQGGCRPWSGERYTVPPLHARRSYRATKNVGKLLADASACHARYAAIVERVEDAGAMEALCTLKNLDTGEQWAEVPLKEVARRVAGPA